MKEWLYFVRIHSDLLGWTLLPLVFYLMICVAALTWHKMQMSILFLGWILPSNHLGYIYCTSLVSMFLVMTSCKTLTWLTQLYPSDKNPTVLLSVLNMCARYNNWVGYIICICILYVNKGIMYWCSVKYCVFYYAAVAVVLSL